MIILFLFPLSLFHANTTCNHSLKRIDFLGNLFLRKEERIQHMKKRNSALCLFTLLTTAAAVVGCNQATPDANGSVMTYTDASGNVVSYTAKELLGSYQEAGASASTEFDKVYEVLVRKYYQDPANAAELKRLTTEADYDVANDQTRAQNNAESNGTTYEAEFESILNANGVKNIDELKQYHLYQREKTQFEQDYNDSHRDAMRDGSDDGLTSSDLLFAEDPNYGIANKGFLKEELPYHIRHILVKVSAASGNYTQGKLSEPSDKTAGEATKLATTIMRLAGANTVDGASASTSTRETFGAIAQSSSDDESSGKNFGEIGLMTARSGEGINYVNEFRLGTFAFESLYNQSNTSAYALANKATITPGLEDDSTNVDVNQKLDDSGETINSFFASTGIGTIPYGAAVAMLKAAKITTDANGAPVNDGNKEAFYPRNILFNKYFNKHNVCVITPNEIAYNMASPTDAQIESEVGELSTTYAALPGFQNDTTAALPGIGSNVLTDEAGHIVLAVRAGTSSYQGVHFIIIQRSGLDLYGNGTDTQDDSIPTLSQYYVLGKTPGETGYPTDASGKAMTTYINFNKQQSADWTSRKTTLLDLVKSYNTSLNTYIFQDLIKDGSIRFTDAEMEARIQVYSKTKRQSAYDDSFTTWKEAWKTYAEQIEAQMGDRALTFDWAEDGGTYYGNATDKGRMLSEVCAIGYQGDHSGAEWQKGGRCYYVK